MVKYNSKDIINRAKRIADLENSDFITYNEQIQMLNDCYNEVYQKIINKGDLYFIKEIYMSDGDTLPDDFYQLNDITKENIHLRRGDDYKLINNKLKLTNYSNVKVSYYPVPETLFIEADPVNQSLNDKFKFNGRPAIFKLGNGEYINVVLLSNSMECRYKDDLVTIEYANNIYPNQCWMDNNYLYVLARYQYTELTGYLNLYRYAIGEGDDGLYVINTFTKELNPVKLSPLAIDIPNHTIYGSSNYNVNYTKYNYVNDTTETIQSAWPFDGSYGFLKGDTVYNAISMVDNECIYYNDSKHCHLFTSRNVEIPYGFGTPVLFKVDEETGYGYIYNNVIYSAFDNTELEYPNNLFFSYMAYKLAVYMKARQNGDYSKLLPLVQEAELHFFDTLSDDSNDYTTIENVYTKRRMW